MFLKDDSCSQWSPRVSSGLSGVSAAALVQPIWNLSKHWVDLDSFSKMDQCKPKTWFTGSWREHSEAADQGVV